MKITTRSIALSLLVLAFVSALLLVMKFRAGAALSILCYLTGLVASVVGAGFHCGWH